MKIDTSDAQRTSGELGGLFHVIVGHLEQVCKINTALARRFGDAE